MIRVLFVCLGNICRSPMAEAVFRHLVEEVGLAHRFEVDSAGTSGWHVGEPPCGGTLRVLRREGIALGRKLARQISSLELDQWDYVIAMDRENLAALRRLDRRGASTTRYHLLMEFAPDLGYRDVPDPYYEGNFDLVYRLVRAGCEGLLEHIRRQEGLA